jgi:hypothetical protein
LAVRAYALVEIGDSEAIDLFLREEDAERVLEDAIRDEPDWAGVLRVQAIELDGRVGELMTLGPLSAVASWITKTIFLVRDRKRRVNTAAQFIANELAFNAETIKGWERQDFAMADVREQLVLTAWESNAASLGRG